MTNKTYAVKKDGVFHVAIDRGPEHGWKIFHLDDKHFFHEGRLYAFDQLIKEAPEDLQEWSEIFLNEDRSLARQGQQELTWQNFDQKGRSGTLISIPRVQK